MMEQLEQIEKILEPYVKEMELDLVDLKVWQRQGLRVQILVDRPQGGITIEECAELNKKMAAAMDQTTGLGENYFLEVSSPGLDRPLRSMNDFRRAKGKGIRLFLLQPFEGRQEFQGTVTEVNEETLTIDIHSRELRIPLGLINKGMYIL